jgi:hypothetical protein
MKRWLLKERYSIIDGVFFWIGFTIVQAVL